jgi:hypothetical protein
MRQRATIGGLLLVVLGVILGATVFRTDIAQATGLADKPNVTVVNTPAQPVPVHEVGTAKVEVVGTPAQTVSTSFADLGRVASGVVGDPVDVSGFKQIRLVASGLTCGGNDQVQVSAREGNNSYSIAIWNFCSDDDLTLEVPGRTLRLTCFCDSGHYVDVGMFGRSN